MKTTVQWWLRTAEYDSDYSPGHVFTTAISFLGEYDTKLVLDVFTQISPAALI